MIFARNFFAGGLLDLAGGLHILVRLEVGVAISYTVILQTVFTTVRLVTYPAWVNGKTGRQEASYLGEGALQSSLDVPIYSYTTDPFPRPQASYPA